MRSRPVSPCRSALISSRMARLSPTMRRAQSSTRSPSLGGTAGERGPAVAEQDALRLLELLAPRRQRRLGDAAGLRGAAEVPFAGERQHEVELVDHNSKTFCGSAR